MARRGKQRRSLTTAQSDAPVKTEGAPEVARALAAALRPGRAGERIARELTHGFHSYPARMHPAAARALVELTLARAGRRGKRPAVVLDPFCGSGTVLVEARRVGARARGVDANPLAVLIARAKTSVGRPEHRAALRERGAAIAADVIAAGKQARRAGAGRGRQRTPRGADPGRRQRLLSRWFDPHVRRELEELAAAIEREPAAIRPVLTAVLSSILYKVSRRESDTSAQKVERKVARGAAARLFERRAAELVDGLDELARVDGPNVGVATGDARKLGRADIEPASVDAVITSPPYAGTYDYLDHQGLRFAFLGIGVSRFARAEIGPRRAFSGDAAARREALARWQRDLGKALSEAARALRAGGQLAIVLGDSLAGTRAVYADQILAQIAPDTLTFVAIASQPRTPFGAAEQRAFARQHKREHIAYYEKR